MSENVRSNSWKLLLVLILSAMFCGSGHAQLSTATMFGSIMDSTGAVIPHATLTLTQTDTNFTRTVTTKDDGSYRHEFLPVARYKIPLTTPAFRATQRSGVFQAA